MKFYLTTTIYYVNDVPHIGHAYTTLAGDVVARYWRRKLGKEIVFFLTGTDEHGQKIQEAAEEKKLTPKDFADGVVPRFQEAWKLLDIDYDFFIRTTDPRHEKVVTELLTTAYQNGFIYKGTYKGLYCVGCEKFLTESDMVHGRCPLHPNKSPEYQEEENYFLKLQKLSKEVLKRIENKEYDILPEKRKNEIISRLKQGVEDISISRAGVTWGIPLPWDKNQTIYVWVDALINYYSATRFVQGRAKFWPADLHLIGKDIVWFHTVIWQALLIAAGMELPKAIFAHGFFTINGQKISKSLGNVISPQELIQRYKSADAVRYLLLTSNPFGEDGDISIEKFDSKYQSDLANGLGNLVQRVAKLCEGLSLSSLSHLPKTHPLQKDVSSFIEQFRFNEALALLWDQLRQLDQFLNREHPWDRPEKEKADILRSVLLGTGDMPSLLQIAVSLSPFLPATSERILDVFKGPTMRAPESPLFPRIV